MPDQPDITHPHPALVAKEVSEIIADYGPAYTAERMEQLARGAEVSANAYDGGPALAHAVAAEFRRRGADMKRSARATTLPLAFDGPAGQAPSPDEMLASKPQAR
jgi:hypothetical protein